MNFEIEFEVGKDSKWWEKNENEELARKEGKPKKPKKKNKIKKNIKRKGNKTKTKKASFSFNILVILYY